MSVTFVDLIDATAVKTEFEVSVLTKYRFPRVITENTIVYLHQITEIVTKRDKRLLVVTRVPR